MDAYTTTNQHRKLKNAPITQIHTYTHIYREWRALPPCSHDQEILVDRAATGFYQVLIY